MAHQVVPRHREQEAGEGQRTDPLHTAQVSARPRTRQEREGAESHQAQAGGTHQAPVHEERILRLAERQGSMQGGT